MLVEVIGADAWAQKITAEARKFSKVHSEIQDSINRILKWITIVLPWIIALLTLVPNARRGQLVAHCHNLYSCGRRGNDSTGTGPAHFDELGLAAAITARREF